MISKKDITKAAKKIFKRQRGLRDHQMIHPQREWLVGLLLGGVFLVVGAMWSATTYVAVDERDVVSAGEEETGQSVYREDIVLFALEEFRTRAENYTALLNQGGGIPSDEEVVETVEAITASEAPATTTESIIIEEPVEPVSEEEVFIENPEPETVAGEEESVAPGAIESSF